MLWALCMECSVCLYVGVGVLGHVSLRCLKGSVTYSLLMVEFRKQEEALILSLHGGLGYWAMPYSSCVWQKGAHIFKINETANCAHEGIIVCISSVLILKLKAVVQGRCSTSSCLKIAIISAQKFGPHVIVTPSVVATLNVKGSISFKRTLYLLIVILG